MPASRRSPLLFGLTLPFGLFVTFMVLVWLAGGASRGDALGQTIVRAGSWLVLIVLALAGPRPVFHSYRPVALFLVAALALPLLQLVPLPPALWQALPGRAVFVQASVIAGEAQPWRPWAIVPDAAANAASSLVVPFATLMLVGAMGEDDRKRLPGALLCLVGAATLVGLLQFSGATLDNPFVNDTVGEVSGTFANRNHMATFQAIGCLLAAAWAFGDRGRSGWRGGVALAMLPLFLLVIMASGSRAGILVGAIALVLAVALIGSRLRRQMNRAPRWLLPAALTSVIGLIALMIVMSVLADRAEAIHRIVTIDVGEDMRRRALPTVLTMIRDYFPAGAGMGGFDPLFRLHEPFDLLKFTFFNHAHNDYLEIVLDAGLPGLALLASALLWWGWSAAAVWRAREGRDLRPRLGAAILLLVLIASAFDYPARTPIMMVIVTIAALWLCDRLGAAARSSLPSVAQRL